MYLKNLQIEKAETKSYMKNKLMPMLAEHTLRAREKRLETKLSRNKNTKSERKASEIPKQLEFLSQKFEKSSREKAYNKASRAFIRLLGRHIPISYAPDFGFMERWQTDEDEQVETSYRSSLTYALFSVVQVVLMSVCIWGVSTQLFFFIENHQWIATLLILSSLVKILQNIALSADLSKRKKIVKIVQQVINIVYAFFLIRKQTFASKQLWERILGIYVSVQLFNSVSEIYNSIKNYHISSSYREIVNLFDLFVLLAAITHVFGLVMSLTAEMNPQQNWMLKAGIWDRHWMDQYIYSIYFSSTTLLTVGYGDLAPTNVTQILAILLTEFIGIAAFGYTVNQIGAALSSLHQKSQKLQKDLGTAQNIGKSYRLEPEVICKMRTEIINSKRINDDFCVKEQNQLISHFTEDLREKIKLESNMKVLKRSVFMLVNWTGKMQNKIARKMIKEVFQPEELLLQALGKQKLYILDKGRIGVYNHVKNNSRLCFQKQVKQLVAEQESEVVVENVYGYSSMVSDRKINLNAYAKVSSICFTLTKSDFMEIITECEEDLQHYFQIKCMIENSSMPEEIEAPLTCNIREHYRPSAVFLIAKNKDKNLHKNQRQKKPRRRLKTALICKQYDERIEPVFARSSQQISEQRTPFTAQNLSCRKIVNGSVEESYDFESYKNYERFFKKFNIQSVIKRMSTQNYAKKQVKYDGTGERFDRFVAETS